MSQTEQNLVEVELDSEKAPFIAVSTLVSEVFRKSLTQIAGILRSPTGVTVGLIHSEWGSRLVSSQFENRPI